MCVCRFVFGVIHCQEVPRKRPSALLKPEHEEPQPKKVPKTLPTKKAETVDAKKERGTHGETKSAKNKKEPEEVEETKEEREVKKRPAGETRKFVCKFLS